MKGILNSTLADLDAMLNVLIRANFTITQRALPTIIKHKGKCTVLKTCHESEDSHKYVVNGLCIAKFHWFKKGKHY